jgi:hypothetical protein
VKRVGFVEEEAKAEAKAEEEQPGEVAGEREAEAKAKAEEEQPGEVVVKVRLK